MTELADKIDRDSVGFIVHEKYEEIVRYLQDALQSSLEDENNFKRKADDIQEMVVLLSHSKADRSEIANMQELMVKTEALMKKVNAQTNIKDKLSDMVTKKELEEFLETKVDKAVFDTDLAEMVAAVSKKGRKLGSLSSGIPPVEDGINRLSSSRNLQIHKDMLKAQQAEEARLKYENGDPSDDGVRQHGGWHTDGRMISLSQAEIREKDQREREQREYLADVNRRSSSPPAGGTGTAVLGLRPGKSDRQPPGAVLASRVPVIAVGRSLSPPKSGGVDPRGDFSQFVKSKKSMMQSASAITLLPASFDGEIGGGGRDGVLSSGSAGGGTRSAHGNVKSSKVGGTVAISSSLPSALPPGSFKTASESGKPGGGNGNVVDAAGQQGMSPQNSIGSLKHNPAGYGPSSYPFVPPAYDVTYEEQSKTTDNLAYLTGPVIGGGFNVQSRHLQHALPAGNTVPSDDVEGKDLMVKSADGHMYYKDLSTK